MSAVDQVVEVIVEAAPEIRSGLPGRRQKADEENPSGEVQLAADVWADKFLADRITAIDGVGEFASEEREETVDCGEGVSVAIDPLDGSSNITSNNAMGTIFGVYDTPLPAKGRDLVASGYVLFGPITTMMLARDGNVSEYVIEASEARMVEENVTLPGDPVVYGFGGRVPDWPEDCADYAREIEQELKLRYGGAMIGDVNQVMTYGGIFAYPGLQSRPEGKLRLQFECNPIAYIVESAGGRSSDGKQSVLDVEPTGLHQRVPVHLGNEELIDRLEVTLGND